MELSHVDLRARASRSHLVLGWSQARWIVFESSQLGDGVLQEDLGLFCLDVLDLVLKVDSVDMLKFTIHTQVSSLLVLVFLFNRSWFSCQKHRYKSLHVY